MEGLRAWEAQFGPTTATAALRPRSGLARYWPVVVVFLLTAFWAVSKVAAAAFAVAAVMAK